MIRQAVSICVIAVLPAILATMFHPKRPGWSQPLRSEEVSLPEMTRMKPKPLLVDARSASSYQREHIPGAFLLNEDGWHELLPNVLGSLQPDQPIVVYCDSRVCQSSHKVAERLREAGLGPVFVLQGGWKAWQETQR
jgi:rhodanese-related sulfurtransferase